MTSMHQVGVERVADASLVARLLREQFPQLVDQEVRPSHTSGSSNFVFRVGDAWAVRLPRTDDYIADLLTEARWLPRLAPHLEVPVPEVRFLAQPSALFARPWTVVTWVPASHRWNWTRKDSYASPPAWAGSCGDCTDSTPPASTSTHSDGDTGPVNQ